MKKPILVVFVILIMTAWSDLSAQLSGTYYIPSGVPGFPTIEAAISALNLSGTGPGGVIFEVAAGHTETFSSALAGNLIATGTVANPILFRKSGGGTNPLITASGEGTVAPSTTLASHGDGVIILNGGDYITFDGISIAENPGASNGTKKSEYGYYLKKASGTDGCQHVTIRNCGITLDNSVVYSFGIFVSNITGISETTVTSTGGRNEFIRIYGNTLTGGYGGILLTGYSSASPYAFYDQNIEVGKDGPNAISGFGGGASTVYGIYATNQNNLNISGNLVTSGPGTTANLYGIIAFTGINSNLDLYGNTVTLTSASATGALCGISNSMGASGTSNTVNIYDNIVQGCSYTAPTTGTFTGMETISGTRMLNLYGNQVKNNVHGSGTSVATGTIYYIRTEGANPSAGSLWSIHDNTISGNSRSQSAPGAGTTYGLSNLSSGLTLLFNNNQVLNNTWPSTSAAFSLYVSTSSADSINIQGNMIHHNSKPNAVHGVLPKSGGLYGLYLINQKTGNKLYVRNNQVYNQTNTYGGAMMACYVFPSATGTCYIQNNLLHDLSTDDVAQTAIYLNSGQAVTLNGNRVYGNTAAGSNGSFYGIRMQSSAGGTVTAYNNVVSDLRAPDADYYLSAGMIVAGSIVGTTYRLFNNTVYLANTFGPGVPGSTVAALYTTSSPNTDIRNNIFVNVSNPGPSGYTVAYWRSGTNPSTYSALSNFNCWHAGTTGPSNAIYYDETNEDLTFAGFQSRFPQEAQSFTGLPPFINIASAPFDLHLSSSTATPCESGGSSIYAPSITTDNESTPRYPNPGYPADPLYPPTAPDAGAYEFGGIPDAGCTTPTPGNTVSSANGICLGQSVTLSLQNNAVGTGIHYQWMSSANNVNYSPVPNANTMSIAVSPSSATYYRCDVTCQNGPVTVSSTPLQITFASNISSVTPGSNCGTGTVTLAATAGAGTITWFAAASGGSPLATGSSFITPVLSSTTTYYVSSIDGSCESPRLAVTATIKPVPSNPSLSFSGTECIGHNVTYTTGAGMAAYSWSIPPGGNVVSGGGSADNSVTVHYNNSVNSPLSVNHYNVYGCPAQQAASRNVLVYSDPVISGPAFVCPEGGTYRTSSGMTNYVWGVTPGMTIVAGGGTSDDFITISFAGNGSGTLSLNYTNPYGCPGNTPAALNITAGTMVPPVISGPATVQQGQTAQYSVPADPGYLYTWNINPGWVSYCGSTSCINVTWTDPCGIGPNGTVTLYKTIIGSGCATTTTLGVSITP